MSKASGECPVCGEYKMNLESHSRMKARHGDQEHAKHYKERYGDSEPEQRAEGNPESGSDTKQETPPQEASKTPSASHTPNTGSSLGEVVTVEDEPEPKTPELPDLSDEYEDWRELCTGPGNGDSKEQELKDAGWTHIAINTKNGIKSQVERLEQ